MCRCFFWFWFFVFSVSGHLAAERAQKGSAEQQAQKQHWRTSCLSQNCLKDIFNEKKRSIVRVVCVPKLDLKSNDESDFKQVISGSGFFVSPKAHILTAASIVKNSNTIWVDYMGASYPAECIGLDQSTNIAILKLLQSPEAFDVIDIFENDHKKIADIGSFAILVGCKLGMDPLPELGNISGKNITYSDNEFLTTYLRTSLACCGGESGSPVFGLDGDLIGVMIASLPEMSSSFVLPKRTLSRIFNEIIKNGVVRHLKLGINVISEYVFGRGQEIVISRVVIGSEAEKAGLCVGDIIKKIGDFDIRYREDLYNAVFFCFKENMIDVIVLRDGKELSFKVKSEYLVD